MSEDPALMARSAGATPMRITAVLYDGGQISCEVDYAPGFYERPMSSADVEPKFRGNIGKEWSKRRTDAVLDAWLNIEKFRIWRTLLGKFSFQP